MTLMWLVDPECTEAFMHGRDTHMQCLHLQKALWGILHGMLIGHLQSHHLQLEEVPMLMLALAKPGLLQKEVASHQPQIELLRALLMRLARDTKFTNETCDDNTERQLPSYLMSLWDFIGELLLPPGRWPLPRTQVQKQYQNEGFDAQLLRSPPAQQSRLAWHILNVHSVMQYDAKL